MTLSDMTMLKAQGKLHMVLTAAEAKHRARITTAGHAAVTSRLLPCVERLVSCLGKPPRPHKRRMELPGLG